MDRETTWPARTTFSRSTSNWRPSRWSPNSLARSFIAWLLGRLVAFSAIFGTRLIWSRRAGFRPRGSVRSAFGFLRRYARIRTGLRLSFRRFSKANCLSLGVGALPSRFGGQDAIVHILEAWRNTGSRNPDPTTILRRADHVGTGADRLKPRTTQTLLDQQIKDDLPDVVAHPLHAAAPSEGVRGRPAANSGNFRASAARANSSSVATPASTIRGQYAGGMLPSRFHAATRLGSTGAASVVIRLAILVGPPASPMMSLWVRMSHYLYILYRSATSRKCRLSTARKS